MVMMSNFDLNFRDQIECILKTFVDRLVGPCLKNVSCKYHGQALRNKKVIRSQANWPMKRKVWSEHIFAKIDAAAAFRLVN